MTEITEVFLDSDDKTSGTLDRPVITLRDTINQVVGFAVAEAQIPLSFYNVDSDCNIFYYKDVASNAITPITIPAADYASTTTLRQALYDKPGADPATGVLASYPVTVTFGNGVLTFTRDGLVGDSPPTISFDIQGPHAADVLGFDMNTVYPFTWTGSVWSLTAPKPPLIEMPKYLYLCSNLSELVHNQIRVNDFNSSQIIAKIPLPDAALLKATVTSYTPVVHYTKQWASDAGLFFRFTTTFIHNMSFYLTRANRQVPIPFKGKTFGLTLLFLCDRGYSGWHGKNFDQQ